MTDHKKILTPQNVPATLDVEGLVEKIAGALERSQIDSARELAEKVDFELDRFEKIFAEATLESERSAAILIFAYVEDIMLSAFMRHLNGDVKGGWEEVTGGNGLLSTANDRITLLALLRWIKPKIYNDLRHMKSIRNRFAHHSDVSSCSDSKISSWIADMSYNAVDMTNNMARDLHFKCKPLTKKQEFIMKCSFAVAELLSNLAIAPHAEAAQVHPSKVEGESRDEMLKNVEELRGRASRVFVSQLEFE